MRGGRGADPRRHLGTRRQPLVNGPRVVFAMVVLLIVAAVSVVVARVRWWRQTLVSDGVIRFLASGLAGFFLVHGW
jgi:hypothetical protein